MYLRSAGGISTEDSSEGNLDLASIFNGSYTFYKKIVLDNMTTFRVRVASAGTGGSLQVRLDSPTGREIGACTVS